MTYAKDKFLRIIYCVQLLVSKFSTKFIGFTSAKVCMVRESHAHQTMSTIVLAIAKQKYAIYGLQFKPQFKPKLQCNQQLKGGSSTFLVMLISDR